MAPTANEVAARAVDLFIEEDFSDTFAATDAALNEFKNAFQTISTTILAFRINICLN